MATREGKIFQHGCLFVHSGGLVEVVEYDYESLVSVNEGNSDEAFEFPPDHLWLVCGGISAVSALW